MTCPITPGIQGVLENGDGEGIEWLKGHANGCADCRAEIERLTKAKEDENDAKAKKLLSAIGLAIWFFLGRGVVDVINQVQHDAGHWTPPWFRPRK